MVLICLLYTSGFLFYQVTEIIDGKTQLVSAILYRRNTFTRWQGRMIVIIEQQFKTRQQIVVGIFPCNEMCIRDREERAVHDGEDAGRDWRSGLLQDTALESDVYKRQFILLHFSC